MIGRIICTFCCLLCAFPFLTIPAFSKDSKDPMSFWTGDNSLKEKVKDVKGYNYAMAKLYKQFGMAFLLCAVLSAALPALGFAVLMGNCTIGIYLVYRKYKSILAEYS